MRNVKSDILKGHIASPCKGTRVPSDCVLESGMSLRFVPKAFCSVFEVSLALKEEIYRTPIYLTLPQLAYFICLKFFISSLNDASAFNSNLPSRHGALSLYSVSTPCFFMRPRCLFKSKF